MNQNNIKEIVDGLQTAFIDNTYNSNLAYRPQLITNDYRRGLKVISQLENELMHCDEFLISVAFINRSGFTILAQTLKELERRGIKGKILTTDYLCFSDPYALDRLAELTNVELKIYHVEDSSVGFHTKGYLFRENGLYRIIIGSSNMTQTALSTNMEWNTRLVSTEQGELAQAVVSEFEKLWIDDAAKSYEKFIEYYRAKYNRKKQFEKLVRGQQKIALQEDIVDFETYTLKPNKMQIEFIANMQDLIERGAKKALLISATGTGKTYASAFAMRELGFKHVLFVVHRAQLARQTKKSYEKVFGSSVSMGLVGGGYQEYDNHYIFATVQTLNRDSHLMEYAKDAFDCIILDEAHHSSAKTFQKLFDYFTPKLWLGMTATPDKRDDDQEGRNIYQIFDYNIAYEIRLQQAMEEDLLCPFHYFGIQDIVPIQEEGQLLSFSQVNSRDFNFLTCDERVRHILEQAQYYGSSGDRVKGLIFCSRIDETEKLSKKFNQIVNPATGRNYRTIALNGKTSETERQEAFECLAMDEEDATPERQPLDYIFSVEILNDVYNPILIQSHDWCVA